MNFESDAVKGMGMDRAKVGRRNRHHTSDSNRIRTVTGRVHRECRKSCKSSKCGDSGKSGDSLSSLQVGIYSAASIKKAGRLGMDKLQNNAYQGEEYGCHSRSSPVQTELGYWDAQDQDNSRSMAESQDQGQASERTEDSDVSTHDHDQDQEIIEDKHQGEDNLDEHGQCSDYHSQHPIEMIVLKQERLSEEEGEEEDNGRIIEEGLQVEEEEIEDDILMHIESFPSHSSNRTTIEPHTLDYSKVEGLESIEEGESNEKYHYSSTNKMQIQDFSPDLVTAVGNNKSEIEKKAKQKYFCTYLHTQSGEKRYWCAFCDYETTDKSHLTTHLNTHNRERPYSCAYCDKTFEFKSALARHLYTHTGGEKPLSCEFCDYRTAHRSHLNTHLLKHNKEKSHSCEFCDYKTSHKSHLTRHLHIHTGEKPHSCTFCDETFSQKTNLTRHLYKHTGEKPYRCEFCPRAFNQKSCLTTHLYTHTGERPYSCRLCNYKATTQGNLKKHLKIKHENPT